MVKGMGFLISFKMGKCGNYWKYFKKVYVGRVIKVL